MNASVVCLWSLRPSCPQSSSSAMACNRRVPYPSTLRRAETTAEPVPFTPSVRTFSTSFQGRPCGRPPAALRPGSPTGITGRRPHPSRQREAEPSRAHG
jgi:hypothetical protein